MLNVLLFGTGQIATDIVPGIIQYNLISGYKIIGFLDNDPVKYGQEFAGYKVYHPGQMSELAYDCIICCCNSEKSIREQLVYGYHVEPERIRDRFFLLQLILEHKYSSSQDKEIQSILSYWKQGNAVTVFNNYIDVQHTVDHEVRWDSSNNMPYILFDTIDLVKKRMYFPRNYKFATFEGRPVVRNLMYEQSIGSPHQYTYNEHDVQEGGVVIDAGVCEGNFALLYINIVKKIYLFECDPIWQEALYYTFKNDLRKIELVKKYVSNRSGVHSVTIDDIIKEKVDFLKMDVEGAEIEGLLGAENTLRNSTAKCSICCYHRHNDEIAIKKILQGYGYTVDASPGYMLFLYDPELFYHAEFRRGILYGKKA